MDIPSEDRAYANDVVELFQVHEEQERIAAQNGQVRQKEPKRVAKEDAERIEKERGTKLKKKFDDKMKQTAEAEQDEAERAARGESGYQGQVECPQCKMRRNTPHPPKGLCPECEIELEPSAPLVMEKPTRLMTSSELRELARIHEITSKSSQKGRRFNDC